VVNGRLEELRVAAVANTLRACQLFSELPSAELGVIASFAVTKRLGKGEYLFRERTPSEGFYVVQSGAINVHRESPGGKEQVICVFRAGQSFAEAALASPVGYPADARAVVDSVVLLLPKREVLDLLGRRPDLALRMLGSMSAHLRVLVGLVDDLTLKDVEARLAGWLLRRRPRIPGEGPYTVHLESTKRTLAAEIGTASETLSRTLAKFRAQRLIRTAGRAVVVLDPAGLRRVFEREVR